jgi:DNA-binding LacI/PurR family transcriptional regulator
MGVRENIGLVIADLYEPNIAAEIREKALFIEHLAQGLNDQGYNLMLSAMTEPITPESQGLGRLPKMLEEAHCRRLIVTSYIWPELAELAEHLRRLHIDVVAVDAPLVSQGVPTIQNDEALAVEILVDHLVELGHRRIAFLNHGPVPHAGYRDQLRPDGYLRAMAWHQLLPVLGWDLLLSHEDNLARILAMDPRPTALIAYDEVVVIYLIAELSALGINVPDDISLVAVGDIGVGHHYKPTMTRIETDHKQMAAQTVHWVLSDKLESLQEQVVIEIPGKLIVGQTSAPPKR